MTHWIAALLALSLTSCVMRSGAPFQERDKRLANLQREKDKLKRSSDPVSHTKTQIKISELLLTFVGDAVKKGDMEILDQRLSEYVSTIQDAHQTMAKTGRDAHRKPGGFRELEISLRRQINQLKDIGGALTFDQRDSVEKAREEAANIRDELLKALFGSPNVTSGD